MNELELEYKSWISELKTRYQSSQIKAAVKVNNELLKFYWLLGRDIVSKKIESEWGRGFYQKLSYDLIKAIPNVKGFSVRNLHYMKQMYVLFTNSATTCGKNEDEECTQLVDQLSLIPWGHIRYIIDTCKNDSKKALFFVQKTIENNWSRAALLNFLDTDLYERQGTAVSNFSATLPAIQSELAQQMTKDPYSFDFISISEKYDETELKLALIQNIEKFLLELGKGFAYMGREFRLQVGSEEKFMDMLFYNVNLRCYVVIEVKVEKFEASHLGQLGLYVSAVNHILRKESDNPTIGLLICKSKDDVVAQYSLESSAVPIGISEYDLQKLYPVDFRSSLPSIEEIENELKTGK